MPRLQSAVLFALVAACLPLTVPASATREAPAPPPLAFHRCQEARWANTAAQEALWHANKAGCVGWTSALEKARQEAAQARVRAVRLCRGVPVVELRVR